ncbi:MBL fold metallo-hydrolase [Rugosimonospora acidiphila]|uniref:MBL fold metallo-hydrolase n=1 Tax=Rugosimonospora acidiphila TaxID=556531 RepID=A0ABP9S359_9ACTN
MKRFAGDWIQIRTEYLETCGLPLYLNAIAGEDGIVLLDSGVAATPEASISGELAAAGLRVEDIALVVNSHAHPDHMGGNANLRRLADPEFAAPAAEAAWLEDNDLVIRELWEPNPDAYLLDDAERADLYGLFGDRVRVDRLLRDGDTIVAGGTPLTVITTSGHSPGHIAMHDPQRGVLFTFDDVQGAGTPVAHSDVWLPPLYHDVERYLAGLRRLAAADFELLVPAHGDHLDRAAGLARIEESIAFVERAGDFVAGYVARHGETRLGPLAHALGTELGPYDGVNLQTMSVAKAHLDQLVRRGALTPVWRHAPGPA